MKDFEVECERQCRLDVPASASMTRNQRYNLLQMLRGRIVKGFAAGLSTPRAIEAAAIGARDRYNDYQYHHAPVSVDVLKEMARFMVRKLWPDVAV